MEEATQRSMSIIAAKRQAEAEGTAFDDSGLYGDQPAEAKKQKKTAAVKNTSVYVSGLPRDITEQELSDTFGKIGALRKVRVYRMESGELKGDALVTYDLSAGDSAFGAERLLNGRDIRTGWRMSVSIAQFDKEAAKAAGVTRGPTPGAGGAVSLVPQSTPLPPDEGVRRIVLLRNTFVEADGVGDPTFYTDLEADIAEECGKCGKVLLARSVLRAQLSELEALASFAEGTIRVTFSTQAEGERCVTMMNGRRFDGRTIQARLAPSEKYDPPPDVQAIEGSKPKEKLPATQAEYELRMAKAAAAPPKPKKTGDATLDSFFSDIAGL